MKRTISILLMAVLMLQSVAFATTLQTEKLTFKATKDGDKIVLTVTVRDMQFNVLQFAVKYDTAKLTPRDVTSGADVSTTQQMADYLGNEFYMGDGWMEAEPNALDAAAGIAEYTLHAVKDSAAYDSGNLNEAGYKAVDEEGLDVIALHFTLKAGATFTADSIQLVPTEHNSYGIICGLKGLEDYGTIRGQKYAVRDFTELGIPLSETAYAAPAPSQGGSGAEAGVGAGAGAGGAAGGGLPVEEVPPESMVQVPADVKGHWAEANITRMMENGLLTGYEDGSVRPGASLTRGQMSAILCKMFGLEPVTDQVAFADVKGNWSAPYVTAAYRAGLVSGRSADSFDPNGSITRQEICVILNYVLNLPVSGQAKFPDIDQTDSWALNAVNAMAAAGFLSGDDQGRLNPKKTLTRAELSVLICKALDY